MKTFALVFLAVATPATTFGQAAIVGAVSDSSGAALAGATVVASSSERVPGGPWLQPLAILTPRVFKITAEVGL